MKAKIDKVHFNKEVKTKNGIMYSFRVEYNGKLGSYLCKSKEQNYFIQGQECEFTEVEKTYNDMVYYDVKPVRQSNNSGYSKARLKEQSRYSGFAMSYAKDLVIADKIKLSEMFDYASFMFERMVDLDKSLEQ